MFYNIKDEYHQNLSLFNSLSYCLLSYPHNFTFFSSPSFSQYFYIPLNYEIDDALFLLSFLPFQEGNKLPIILMDFFYFLSEELILIICFYDRVILFLDDFYSLL